MTNKIKKEKKDHPKENISATKNEETKRPCGCGCGSIPLMKTKKQ